MNKNTKIILGIILAMALGGLAFTYLKAPEGSSNNTKQGTGTFPAVTDVDWQKKATSTDVTVVEYADFQCPACGVYYSLVKKLEDTYAGRVTFVFRHFPLSMHINAVPAALAAEAAGAQGKFFEMSDKLFTHQADWSESKTPETIFIAYATELGLNTEQFTADMKREDLKQKIVASFKGGVAAKVNATPSFFINGVKIENPKGSTIDEVYTGFAKLLDEKLGVAQTGTVGTQ